MKKITLSLVILLLLVLGLCTAIILSIDSIVETAVNDFGPKITQTKVHLDKADISLSTGKGTLRGLSVGNPVNRGFKPNTLLFMDKIQVIIDRSSLLTDTIIIDKINIVKPQITYELKKLSESNFDALLANIAQASQNILPKKTQTKNENLPQSTTEKAEQSTDSAKKVIINELLISGASVTVDMTGLPGNGLTLSLPDIHLRNIGKDAQGVSLNQVAELIMSTISKNIRQALVGSGDFALKGGKLILQQGTKVGKKAIQAVEGAADEVSKTIGNIIKGAGSLF